MSELKVVKLCKNSNENKINKFNDNIRATVKVSHLLDKTENDFEWLDLMEDTIRYLDNILRNPNRFIVNEEEIVKVELARRVTVESIRHLSKNTNLIQKIEDNGDVKPSKILNINKDESYDTYENRLIYTLIKNMVIYLELKKGETRTTSGMKDVKKVEYLGKSAIGKENVNINFSIGSSSNVVYGTGDNENGTYEERLEKLDSNIKMLQGTEVYRNLERKHVARVIPPIKKTNLILKNTNFQYAMKLWDFLQNNRAMPAKRTKQNKNYEEKGVLKEYFNDTFLLNYLAMSTLSDGEDELNDKSQIETITDNLIERIVELNMDMTSETLKQKLEDKIAVIKLKREASLSEIQNAFSKSIKNYLEKIENFTFKGNLNEKNI